MTTNVIGIDLGTTNSCVATVIDGVPQVLPNKAGYKVMPSVVAITSAGKKLIGHPAKRQAITNPQNTVFAAKRLIGRSFDSSVVQSFKITAPFEITRGPANDPRVKLMDRTYSIPEIQALILSELKAIAEEFTDSQISKAVITVPAYFKETQRHATKDAGVIAGLDVIRVINEPTAAALAYGYGKNIDQRVVVYDLGGGTFDISILEIHGGMYEVMTSNGDTFLGGEDFDDRIMEWLLEEFMEETGIDLRKDSMAIQRLKEAAETAKMNLSTVTETEINLPFITTNSTGDPMHLKRMLTRRQYEEMTSDLVERTIEICSIALKDAGLATSDIDAVLLVGGMTRMPKVQEAVESFFGIQPLKSINPEEVVAIGAAIQGSMLLEQDSPKSLLLDLTPHSLGIEISGGLYKEIIPKDSPIPISKSHIFTTEKDYQDSVHIVVLQGQDEKSGEQVLLGEFILKDIKKAPRGDVKIKVFFDMDADGTLTVSARDLDTNAEQSIVVSSYGYLSQKEVAGMIEYNREYLLEREQEDMLMRMVYNVKNVLAEIDKYMPTLEEMLSGSVSPKKEEARDRIQMLVGKAKEAIQNDDLDTLATLEAPLVKALDIIKRAIGV